MYIVDTDWNFDLNTGDEFDVDSGSDDDKLY
jgi:hypothetical protein